MWLFVIRQLSELLSHRCLISADPHNLQHDAVCIAVNCNKNAGQNRKGQVQNSGRSSSSWYTWSCTFAAASVKTMYAARNEYACHDTYQVFNQLSALVEDEALDRARGKNLRLLNHGPLCTPTSFSRVVRYIGILVF